MLRTKYVPSEGILDYEEKVDFINWINERAECFEFDLDSEEMKLFFTTENRWRIQGHWTSCPSEMSLIRFFELNVFRSISNFEHEVFEDCEYNEFKIEYALKGLESFYILIDEYIKTNYETEYEIKILKKKD